MPMPAHNWLKACSPGTVVVLKALIQPQYTLLEPMITLSELKDRLLTYVIE